MLITCTLWVADPRSAPADGTESIGSVKTGGYIYSLLEREGGCVVAIVALL